VKFSQKIQIHLTTAVLVVVVLFGVLSCTKDEVTTIEAVKDRKASPGLAATQITTVVSDSGITRYRIFSDQWDIYDRAAEPYWEFPKGLHFERFDENLVIDANFHSNYARYHDYKKLWEFKKNVKAVNIKGEMFETDLLYWDQQQERIYTDKFIRVTQATRVITAVGFESDQSLTKYHFKNVQGIFAVDEAGQSSTSPDE
jgi:LPS export ABC transporter protein LptC